MNSIFEHNALGVSAEVLARFWAKVDPQGPIPAACPELGCCWPWTANTVKGYGQFVLPRTDDGKQPHVYAHRFAYELEHGPIAGGADIKACHRCDFTICVRPSHLFLGTQADNLQDARAKGRLDEKRPRRNVLTYEQRLAVLTSTGSARSQSVLLGVTTATIHRIRRGDFARLRGGIDLRYATAHDDQRQHEGVAAPQSVHDSVTR